VFDGHAEGGKMSRMDEFLEAAEGGEVDKVRALLTDGKDIDIN
jgi:hypothetical protein